MKIHLLEANTNNVEKIGGTSQTGISVTANRVGFTSFHRVTAELGMDREVANRLATTAQNESRPVMAECNGRYLFIVPVAKNNDDIKRLTLDLLNSANSLHIKELLFTHYAFIPSKFPKSHIQALLNTLKSHASKTTISSVWWEIDSRYSSEMKALLDPAL